MRRNSLSGINFLVVGLVLFLVGLLMILQQITVVGLFKGILPDGQSIQIVGVVTQFVGEIIVVLGVMKSASSRILNTLQIERQTLMASFNQGFVQTNERIDKLISFQRTNMAQKTASSCRFCGTAMQQNSFCPKCGKYQN